MFIENLVTGALDRFKEEVGTAASVAVLKQTGEDIRRQVFAMMLPFFRRQVQLARVEVAKKVSVIILLYVGGCMTYFATLADMLDRTGYKGRIRTFL